MTHVKLLVGQVINGSVWPAGSIVPVEDDQARELIDNKQAVPVPNPKASK